MIIERKNWRRNRGATSSAREIERTRKKKRGRRERERRTRARTGNLDNVPRHKIDGINLRHALAIPHNLHGGCADGYDEEKERGGRYRKARKMMGSWREREKTNQLKSLLLASAPWPSPAHIPWGQRWHLLHCAPGHREAKRYVGYDGEGVIYGRRTATTCIVMHNTIKIWT